MHSPVKERERCDMPSTAQGPPLPHNPSLLQDGAISFSSQYMTPEEQYHFANILKLASESSAPMARYHIEGLIGISSCNSEDTSHQDNGNSATRGLPTYEDVMKNCRTDPELEKY